MLKKIGLSLFAVIATYVAAMAVTGNQLGFPIVGGASYCASLGNNSVCNNTIPAGPGIVTGNETIVANTNLSGGQYPQTVLLSLQALNDLPYLYVPVPLAASGNTTTLTNLTGALILDPTTTVAAYTVVTPAATTLVDGQKFSLCATHIISTLTMTAGTGTTINNGLTATVIPVTTGNASCAAWLYVASLTEWFRIQ